MNQAVAYRSHGFLRLDLSLRGKITALLPQKRNTERVNVYLDGQFAFGLSAIEAVRLRVGQELSEAEVRQVLARDEVEIALQRTLNLLERRPRTEAEIRRYLQTKGMEGEIQDELLERLRRVGLVDDDQFARTWVENRQQFRPRSRQMLRYELRQKGVARELIDQALAETDEVAAAQQLATARARRLAGFPRPEFRRKLGAYLARRGFSYEIIAMAVEQAWAAIQPDQDLHENESEE